MGRFIYRVRQFCHALTAPFTRNEVVAEVRQVLSLEQQVLFAEMRAVDRRHAYSVYRTLQASGPHPRDLFLAALLHDVGKTAIPSSLLVRVARVLLEKLAPGLLEGSDEGTGLLRHVTTYIEHAEAGAEMAACAGCPPLTVALIRRHHEPLGAIESEDDRLLALLQEADCSS